MYSITILGKTFETDLERSYIAMQEGAEMIQWMMDNGNTYRTAAIKFDFSEATLRLKLKKLGYSPPSLASENLKETEEAIAYHMEGGDIKDFAKARNIKKSNVITKMNNCGYSLHTKSYTLAARNNQSRKNKSPAEAMWERLLYNKKLSYCADFKMHVPFNLTG